MLSDCYHHSPRWRSQNLSDCALDLEDRFWVGRGCSPQFAALFDAERPRCHDPADAVALVASCQADLGAHCDVVLVDHSRSVVRDVAADVDQD